MRKGDTDLEDRTIIELYWNREEEAISQTKNKYGSFCGRIARNILASPEDAEECLNDTYLKAWNSMPDLWPDSLRAFLGRVIRNLALDRFRSNHAGKRDSNMELLLSELEECIPSGSSVEEKIEMKLLTALIDEWLKSLCANDRILFLRRYWKGDSLNLLAAESKVSPNRLAQRMLRLRKGLKAVLEKEGIEL